MYNGHRYDPLPLVDSYNRIVVYKTCASDVDVFRRGLPHVPGVLLFHNYFALVVDQLLRLGNLLMYGPIQAITIIAIAVVRHRFYLYVECAT